MKRIFLKLVATAFVVGMIICGVSCCKMDTITGNGNLEAIEKTFSSFEKINFEGSAEIRYYMSEEYRTVITIDENLHKYLEVYTQKNTLNIRLLKGNSYRYRECLIEVYCPVITGVTSSGAVSFEGIDKIIAPSFEVKISGAGKINTDIECENFTAKISGSGKMTVGGTSAKANIDISGDGNFSGKDLNTKNTTVNISGSGIVNICVEDNLKANISGSGVINYWGSPKVVSNISGAGRLRKM